MVHVGFVIVKHNGSFDVCDQAGGCAALAVVVADRLTALFGIKDNAHPLAIWANLISRKDFEHSEANAQADGAGFCRGAQLVSASPEDDYFFAVAKRANNLFRVARDRLRFGRSQSVEFLSQGGDSLSLR